MADSNHRILLAAVICAVVLGVVGCGSSGDAKTGGDSSGLPADAVAQVGQSVITKQMLANEMAAIVGGDYFESVGAVAPARLVSEPPRVSACTATVKSILAAKGASVPAAQMKQKCEQLYEAIKEQALSALISDQWSIGLDGERGIKVNNAEAESALRKLEAEQFPKPGEFQTYLADHSWTVAQELLLVRMDLLGARVLARLKAPGGQRVATALNQAADKWLARTNCRAGYVVAHCRQYRAGSLSPLSPAVLVEQIGR